MPPRFVDSDVKLLSTLAEHRILTVEQHSLLTARNVVSVQRRLSQLQEAGLVLARTREHGRQRGRPQNLYSVSKLGARVLCEQSGLGKGADSTDEITADGIHCVDHQLLCNWFRVHWAHVPKVAPQLGAGFLSPNSPFPALPGGAEASAVARFSGAESNGKPVVFTPDGIGWISHKAVNKTILFFLEVDMGSEVRASPSRKKGDFRQKILNYQAMFGAEGYRRLEQIWNCRFNGFRLLVLASTATVRAGLCRLVSQMPPSEFIWVTDREQMMHQGVWNRIWLRGGQADAPAQSILGSQLPVPCPLPPWRT